MPEANFETMDGRQIYVAPPSDGSTAPKKPASYFGIPAWGIGVIIALGVLYLWKRSRR